MPNKKILCILQLPPPVHGASMSNKYLIESDLIKNKFSLELVNLGFNKSINNIGKFTFLKVFSLCKYAITIIKKMMQFKPDLVYYTLAPNGFAFYRDAFYVIIIKTFKTKIIFHLHGKGIKQNTEQNFLARVIYKFILKNTNIICLSNRLVDDIKIVTTVKPYIVPNGIPISSFNSNLSILENIERPQILYLSNYIRTKGVLNLIHALYKLKEKGQKFNARLVGAPGDLTIEYLEQIVREKRLTNSVEIVGPLYGEDKIIEFKKADLFVFPTFYSNEAFPFVLLEALQFGLPVISSYEGGIPDMIIDNETGLLVEAHDIEKLAEKIKMLLNNPYKRIQIGEKGYKRFLEHYTLEHFERNMYKTFQQVLSN